MKVVIEVFVWQIMDQLARLMVCDELRGRLADALHKRCHLSRNSSNNNKHTRPMDHPSRSSSTSSSSKTGIRDLRLMHFPLGLRHHKQELTMADMDIEG